MGRTLQVGEKRLHAARNVGAHFARGAGTGIRRSRRFAHSFESTDSALDSFRPDSSTSTCSTFPSFTIMA